MNALDRFWIQESATVEQAIALIQKNDSRCVVVVGAEQKVVGMFTEGDVLRALLNGVDLHTPLQKLIKPSFRYLRTPDFKAARKMIVNFGITMIPVLNDEYRLESVITVKDVFNDELE